MESSIADLLVQSPTTQLPTHIGFGKLLKLLNFLVHTCKEALESFYIKKNFTAFDPHVGETACQIRAYKTFLLSQQINQRMPFIILKIKELSQLEEKILNAQLYYGKIEHTSKARSLPKLTLEEFINKNDYHLILEKDILFLTLSKILTDFKIIDADGNPQINFSQMRQTLELSREAAKKLSIFYQKKLSILSCEFLYHLSEKLPRFLTSKSLLRHLTLKDDNAREVLPCFLSMKIILSHMLYFQNGFILIIHRKYKNKPIDVCELPFYPDKQHGFKYSPLLKNDGNCVIQVIMNSESPIAEDKAVFIKKLSTYPLEEMILLNQSIHPQFSGKTLASLKINPFTILKDVIPTPLYTPLETELLTFRRKALSQGYGDKNSSFFYIEHIFCARIENTYDTVSGTTLNTEKQEDIALMD